MSRHIEIHENEVAHAPTHHEQVKDFMGSEILVFRVKNRQLSRVDATARSVENAAREKP